MKDAELALGDEASEANLAWLRDVKARMTEMDGTEALIEGFGESSAGSSAACKPGRRARKNDADGGGRAGKLLAKPMVWLQKHG